MLRRLAPLLAFSLLVPACVSPPKVASADAAAPPFEVSDFFVGRTQGDGMLEVMMSGTRAVRVSSVGHEQRDGSVILAQEIREEGKPARTREWRLRQVAPGRYAGTLSDAAGPVTGVVAGNRLHLSFRMRGGMDVDQWLTLAPGGRSAKNVLRVRKFGVTVAALDETIRKVD
ncbi:MAG TPA: DUF3833 family protein [Allosphingosinicella sp.]|nr:DUF3833 family protein [Allosphingosinicella sp.]